MKVKINFQITIDLERVSDFSDIAKQISDHDLNKVAFKKSVEKIDEIKTKGKSGKKHERQNDSKKKELAILPLRF